MLDNSSEQKSVMKEKSVFKIKILLVGLARSSFYEKICDFDC